MYFPLARCSWLRAFCYPGMCPTVPESCDCVDGFQGPNCLQSKAWLFGVHSVVLTISPAVQSQSLQCSLRARCDWRVLVATSSAPAVSLPMSPPLSSSPTSAPTGLWGCGRGATVAPPTLLLPLPTSPAMMWAWLCRRWWPV